MTSVVSFNHLLAAFCSNLLGSYQSYCVSVYGWLLGAKRINTTRKRFTKMYYMFTNLETRELFLGFRTDSCRTLLGFSSIFSLNAKELHERQPVSISLSFLCSSSVLVGTKLKTKNSKGVTSNWINVITQCLYEWEDLSRVDSGSIKLHRHDSISLSNGHLIMYLINLLLNDIYLYVQSRHGFMSQWAKHF